MTRPSEIDGLFGLPLSEFTAARNALAARLTKGGRADEAARVKAIPKPSATAWAVNQLFRKQPKKVDNMLKLGEKVLAAQTGKAKAEDLRVLLAQRRAAISELTDEAAKILHDAGHAASQDARRRMGITLESLASLGRANVGEQAGRLTADLEPLGFDNLATLLAGRKLAPGKVLPFRRTEGKKTEADAAAARAERKAAIQAAEKALTAARREADRAEAALAKATARAAATEKEKRSIEARWEKAREEARAASQEAKHAEQAVADAERVLDRARAALE